MASSTEIRFAVDPANAYQLIKNRQMRALRIGKAKHQHLRDIFYDTPRHALRKADAALTVRINGAETLQILTGLDGQPDREWSTAVNEEKPVTDDLRVSGAPKVLIDRRTKLQPLFAEDLTRTEIQIKTKTVQLRLSLDRGNLVSLEEKRRDALPICEAKLTFESGDAAAFYEIALDLCENNDLKLLHDDRVARGYAFLRPRLGPKPVKAQGVILTEDMTVGEAFALSMDDALDQLFGNHQPTLNGIPEGVHQIRVAIRRIRACLRAFKRALPYDGRKAFNGEFRWFQQRSGLARDWHVFLTESLPKLEKDGADEAIIESLKRLARRERRRATEEVVELFDSRRYARLILQFEKWLAELKRDQKGTPRDKKLKPFAVKALKKTRRDLLQDARPLSRLSGDELHTIRKLAKKARYTGEYFADLFPPERAQPFLKILSRIQTQLGNANDARVAWQLMTILKPKRFDTEATRQVQEWAEARVISCNRKAQPFWRKYQQAEPFWKD
jgi:triphosphatase